MSHQELVHRDEGREKHHQHQYYVRFIRIPDIGILYHLNFLAFCLRLGIFRESIHLHKLLTLLKSIWMIESSVLQMLLLRGGWREMLS